LFDSFSRLVIEFVKHIRRSYMVILFQMKKVLQGPQKTRTESLLKEIVQYAMMSWILQRQMASPIAKKAVETTITRLAGQDGARLERRCTPRLLVCIAELL
jgi:hypothetical protein